MARKGNREVTSKRAASAASKVLRNPRSSKAAKSELCPQSSAIWFDHVAECSRGHGWRGDMGYRSAGHAEPPLGGFLHEFSFVLLE